MDSNLAALIEAGLDSAQIVFGAESEAETGSTLAEAGRSHFRDGSSETTVAALLTNDKPSVELVFGAITAGARLVSLPLPSRSSDPLAYGSFIREACQACNVERVVARDDAAILLETIGVPVVSHSSLRKQSLGAPQKTGFELVQYSSGSTSIPKAVTLTGQALSANILAMLDRVQPSPGDATVSWLPLSHDLGLVGMLLTSTVAGDSRWVGPGQIVLLDPEQFLRSPRIWLDALDHWSATFTASPDFGYRLLARCHRKRSVDLSHLRCAIVGGEIVRSSTLTSMVNTFSSAGLRVEAMCPAYGMAELGLAATMTPTHSRWREIQVDSSALANQEIRLSNGRTPSTILVSSGTPLDGYDIHVSPKSLTMGPLDISAPAFGWDPTRSRSFADDSNVLHSEDIGYVDDDGWVYICGRKDDHIVANGRLIHAPTLESSISEIPEIRDGRVTIVDSPSGDWLVAVEATSTSSHGTINAEQVMRKVRAITLNISSVTPSSVMVLSPGRLPMTSSGKVQRHEVRRRWLSGTLL